MNDEGCVITAADMIACSDRIRPHVHRTPVLTSRTLNEAVGAELFFKCENFQRGGSFKMRGAANAVLSLTDAARERGVVTHSSGNFAQALALAARAVSVPAWVVMPTTATRAKREAVASYGAQVVECPPVLSERERAAGEIVAQQGATFIHPSDDIHVITGQGTAGLELLQDAGPLDVLITPVGGGGLIAGCVVAVRHFGSRCRCVGAEPFAVDDAWRSLQSGRIESNETTDTIADGLKTQLGEHNFPIIFAGVERIVRVKESEIVDAMRLLWERLKVVVEPSSAVAFAALRRDAESFGGSRVGVLLSGGNVDLAALPF